MKMQVIGLVLTNDEVMGSIVEFITVYVVDNRAGWKGLSERQFGNTDMLKDKATLNPKALVSTLRNMPLTPRPPPSG